MNKLKPCPFCGNKMEGCPDYTISFKRDKKKIFGIYHEICTLHCNRCSCTIQQAGASKEEAERNAVNAWNNRADIENAPTVKQPEIIHCCDCVYYDPEHIEKDGVRYEYSDMPKDAFDILGTGLVTSKYGVNVGGRCCRDSVGYLEDKRVFVSEQNYCGRAERRKDAVN